MAFLDGFGGWFVSVYGFGYHLLDVFIFCISCLSVIFEVLCIALHRVIANTYVVCFILPSLRLDGI